jgi:hypothetical protein
LQTVKRDSRLQRGLLRSLCQKYRRMVWRPSHHVWRSSHKCVKRDARHSLCDARHRHNACAFWAGLWLGGICFFSFLFAPPFPPFSLVLQISYLR